MVYKYNDHGFLKYGNAISKNDRLILISSRKAIVYNAITKVIVELNRLVGNTFYLENSRESEPKELVLPKKLDTPINKPVIDDISKCTIPIVRQQ